MPSGRVFSEKYAGDCKTKALEPEKYIYKHYRKKRKLSLKYGTRQPVFCLSFF